jgi:Trk-type K+ transport system membrane component
MFLYCSWQLMLCCHCQTSPLGMPLPLLLYIQEGQGYKEGNRASYNMIPIRTLSLLTYFTYIFIDIIIYALRSMPWSSGIFWMVGLVVAGPSLGLLSLCGLVSNPRVLGN